MSIFDAMNTAHQGMQVSRLRSEVAAENLSGAFTPNYQRKVVDVQGGGAAFHDAMRVAAANGNGDAFAGAATSAVSVANVRADDRKLGERAQAALGVAEMYASKSAYELSIRAFGVAKSMATASLEIGRG